MKKAVGMMSALFAALVATGGVMDDEAAERRAREVLAKMTLEEKCSLMGGCATMYMTAIPRVGISREWAMSDCSHAMKPEHRRDYFGFVEGVDDRSTCLPCQSALAATWNVDLAARHGHVMGEQMRSRGKDQMLGPGVNIVRTPLCGRNWEYISEDPYLNSRMVVPLIRAVQEHGVAATVKHFAVNNQELARTTVNATLDDRTLHEIYLPAFRAAVKEGKVLSVMTSYNRINGTYASENAYLQKAILREKWGFKGQIVTDWGGQNSCDFAMANGCGVEMNFGRGIHFLTDFFGTDGTNRLPLATAVREGRVLESAVNDAVLHQLFIMAKTGFLDGSQEPGERLTEKHRQVCLAVGDEAIVLAKNESGVLPLDRRRIRKLVLLGTFADLNVAHLGSSCENHPPYEITPYKGLKEYLGDGVEIVRLPLGAEAGKDRPQDIDNLLLETYDLGGGEAFAVRAWAYEHVREGKIVKKSYERNPSKDWTRDDAAAPKVQSDDLVTWTAKVRAPESGEFVFLAEQEDCSAVRIVVDGQALSDWNSGCTRGTCRLEKDEVYEISMQFKAGWSKNRCRFGWLPPSAQMVDRAEKRRLCEAADAVIVLTGTSMGFGRAKETEGNDRPNMLEPPGHDEEIAEMLAWKLPKLVVVNRSGSAMEMPWEPDCRTLVIHSYLGQEAGRPLARMLFGEVNPSGKLPVSWPRRLADTAPAQLDAYNATNVLYKERFYVGYRWHDRQQIKPMFPFGYGLSYTTFEYGAVTAKGMEVSVSVTNTGKVKGKEIVQFYAAYPQPRVERCVKELKGFAKVELAPGETKTLTHRFDPRDLAYWDSFEHRFRTDAGTYEILVGASSADIRGKATLHLANPQFFAD